MVLICVVEQPEIGFMGKAIIITIVSFAVIAFKIIRNSAKNAVVNSDVYLRNFDYEQSTNLEQMRDCLNYWAKQKHSLNCERVSRRLLEFDHKNIYANSCYVTSVPYNRPFKSTDEMYFNTLLSDSDNKDAALFHYLYGLFLEQTGQQISAEMAKRKAYKIAPDLNSLYPEFVSKFTY